jgi:hypothetical protein
VLKSPKGSEILSLNVNNPMWLGIEGWDLIVFPEIVINEGSGYYIPPKTIVAERVIGSSS